MVRINSKILIGKVMHARLSPLRHEFSYPLYLYSFDLDELPELAERYWWFGHNKIRPISIHDKDYLASRVSGYLDHNPPAEESSLRERLEHYLKLSGFLLKPHKVILLTGARYFNYVFNPVSFFYCYALDGSLQCVVTEINNTFDERHIYVVPTREGEAAPAGVQPKSFHVSPFNDMEGDYNFKFADIESEFDIKINISKQGKEVFISRLWGEAKPLTSWAMFTTLVRFPFSAALSMPRILWQAAKLRFIKKLPVFTKPAPTSSLTLKPARARWRDRVAMKLVCSVLSKARVGRLVVTLPRGEQLYFGSPKGDTAHIHVHRYKFFWRVFLSGGIGLGESFQSGEWESPDLPGALRFLIDNLGAVNERRLPLSKIGAFFNRFWHRLKRNSRKGSKTNIRKHYDFGNQFFSTFLDPSMTYSSGVYLDPEDSLDKAQLQKIDTILHKAAIRPGDEVLEIGSGWGALAMRAAESRACKVTSLTLSEEQYKYANDRIEKAGLSELAKVVIRDYRDMQGSFDRLVSVEMLEAVGHENLDCFFKACDRLLKQDGIAIFQVITMPEDRHSRYLDSCDWIQKHIFPGASIPSLLSLFESIARSSGFVVESVENFPAHYARTLKEWRERFLKAADSPAIPDDLELRRSWDYYFAYCEAAFECRALGVHQIVLVRPNNATLRKADQALTRPVLEKLVRRQVSA